MDGGFGGWALQTEGSEGGKGFSLKWGEGCTLGGLLDQITRHRMWARSRGSLQLGGHEECQ